MPSTTNPEEEKIVDVPENDGNASMSEQIKRPNPWKKKKKKKKKMMMMMMMMMMRIVVQVT
jgi:predicted nucleic acid-binding Zn ribbon protein